MRKIILLGALCLSATLLLAQTPDQKTKNAENDHPNLVPMNVKTGLWQSTTTVTVTGALGLPPEIAAKMTPEQRARYEAMMKGRENGPANTRTMTDQGCVTQKDLSTSPFKQNNPKSEMQCRQTLLSSTGSDAEIKVSCSGPMASMTYTMKVHAVNQEHATGTGQGTATMGGHTMNSNVQFDSKWLGATCPANLQHDNN